MNEGSVTEELMLPLNRNTKEDGRVNMENDGGDKKNWMSSVQLWNSNFDNVDQNKKPNKRSEEEEDLSKNPIELCKNKSRGGAFVPFKGEADKEISGLSLMTPSSELAACDPNLKSNGSCRIGSGSSLNTEQNQIKFQTKSQHQYQIRNL